MSSAAALLHEAHAFLLDFDGPIAALMPPPTNAAAADQARAALGSSLRLPPHIADTTDHLAVLRYVAEQVPDRLLAVNNACTASELDAARKCAASPYAADLLALAKHREIPVAMVSNNAEVAVRAFFDLHGWREHVQTYACRTPATVNQMKPSPAYLQQAAGALGADLSRCVFIGDSVSDVEAGNAAGVPVIGLAKHDARRAALVDAGAADVVSLGDRAAFTAWPPQVFHSRLDSADT